MENVDNGPTSGNDSSPDYSEILRISLTRDFMEQLVVFIPS